MKPFEIPWNPTTLTPWNTQSKGKNFSGKVYSFRASLDEKVSDLKELTVPWPWGHSFFEEKIRDTRCSYGPKYQLQVLTNPIYRMYNPIEITSYI
jgi:hypothetical protein